MVNLFLGGRRDGIVPLFDCVVFWSIFRTFLCGKEFWGYLFLGDFMSLSTITKRVRVFILEKCSCLALHNALVKTTKDLFIEIMVDLKF